MEPSALLPAIVVLHVVVIAAAVLVLARVLPRRFQRRVRDSGGPPPSEPDLLDHGPRGTATAGAPC